MGRVFDSLTNAIQGSFGGNAQNAQVAQIELAGSRDRRDHAYRVEQDKIQNGLNNEQLRMRQETEKREREVHQQSQTKSFYNDFDRVFGSDGSFDATKFDALHSVHGETMGRLATNWAAKLHPDAKAAQFVQVSPGQYAIEFTKNDGQPAVMDENRSTDGNSKVKLFSAEELASFVAYTQAKADAFTALPANLQKSFEDIAEIGINDREVPTFTAEQQGLTDAYRKGGVAGATQFVTGVVANSGQNTDTPGTSAPTTDVTTPTTPPAKRPFGLAQGFETGYDWVRNGTSLHKNNSEFSAEDTSALGHVGHAVGSFAGSIAGVSGRVRDSLSGATSDIRHALTSTPAERAAKSSKTEVPAPATPTETDISRAEMLKYDAERRAGVIPPTKPVEPSKEVTTKDIQEQPENIIEQATTTVTTNPAAAKAAAETTTRRLKKGGDVRDDPKAWANVVGNLYKYQAIDGPQAVRMLQTGYVDLMSMNMSVFHEDRKLAKQVIEQQRLQEAAKVGKARLEEYQKYQKEFNSNLNRELKVGFDAIGGDMPAGAELDFHNAASFLQLSTRANPETGALEMDPERAANFSRTSPGVFSKAAPIYQKIMRDKDAPGITAATMAIMAVERSTGNIGEEAIAQLYDLSKAMGKNARHQSVVNTTIIWDDLTQGGRTNIPVSEITRKAAQFEQVLQQTMKHYVTNYGKNVSEEQVRQMLLSREPSTSGKVYRAAWDK